MLRLISKRPICRRGFSPTTIIDCGRNIGDTAFALMQTSESTSGGVALEPVQVIGARQRITLQSPHTASGGAAVILETGSSGTVYIKTSRPPDVTPIQLHRINTEAERST